MRLRDRIGLLLSQALNALVFAGDADESVSARAWREQWPRGRARIDRVFGNRHCERVYLAQQARAGARLTQIK